MADNKIIGILLAAVLAGIFGCGGGGSTSSAPAITVSVSPSTATVPGGASQQFKATVGNDPSNSGVSWTVIQNGSPCSPACGTVAPSNTASGAPATYTAPVAVPASSQVTIKAASIADSSKSGSGGVTIPSPVPLINQPLIPNAVAPAGDALILTVNGTGFMSGSVVNWNGNARTTTFANSSQLQADIMASDIAAASTASMTVFNPGPGGGTSGPAFLQITSPSNSVSIARADYVTGNVSYGIATADFRGNGKLDLVQTDYDSPTIGVLLGNGDGTFQSQVTYNVGGVPWAVAVGDFNGDGKPDLVVTDTGVSPNFNAVSILLGNGDGTFKAPVNYSTGGFPNAVAVGDFNRDGHLDLVVSNYYDSTVSILFGNGDGTFQPQAVYSCGCPLGPGSVAIGDFNGDGILDLVVVDDPGVYVLLGNGDGTFQTPVAYGTGNFWGHGSVLVADFNADGKLDVAVADLCGPQSCGGPGAVSILLGNGDGTLQPHVDYPGGPSPNAVVVGDFNGDGKLDLAVANNNQPGSASILLGNGDGTFQAPLTFGTGDLPPVLVLGDFNGDGRLDLALDVLNEESDLLDGISVLLQTSSGK